MLFLFNDPLYAAHIYTPSFVTFALTEFTSAIFISGLLVYWLRELALFRPRLLPPTKSNCITKIVHAGLGKNSCALSFLTFFFVILVCDFMVLNCFYYVYVTGDPSVAGKFDLSNHSTMDVFLGPIIATIIILIVYYGQYVIAF